jgi:hypothetical protein
MRKFSFGLILTVIIMVSCDTYNPVDYNVVNNTDIEIKVIFNQWDYNEGMYIKNDTTVKIEPKKKKNLFVREIIGSSVWNPEYGNDTIWAINKLEIYKDDTVLINRNFRLMEYWRYKNISRHHSELNLTIDNDDIE